MTVLHGNAVVRPHRYICNISRISRLSHHLDSRTEFDSHADTCVAGANFALLWDPVPGRTVSIYGYAGGKAAHTSVPVATVCTTYQHPDTGVEYLLVVHEALYLGEQVPCSLLNPNQLRAHGITVHDTPVQFDPNSSHSVHAFTEQGDPIDIPLTMNGVMSGFRSTLPTHDDVRTLPRVVLTADMPWDPKSSKFADAEEQARRVSSVSSRFPSLNVDAFNEDRFVSAVCSIGSATRETLLTDSGDWPTETQPNPTAGERGHAISAVSMSEVTSDYTPELLSKRWNIGLTKAKRTMKVTTQAGVRHLYGPGERKLRHRTQHLRFPNLKGTWYTDTLFVTRKSLRDFDCGQVVTNGLGYDRVYPLSSKSEAHYGLTRFIQDVGIPKTLVMDNALEQTSGEMGKVIRAHHIEASPLVPHAPWRNKAEASIRELKVALRRILRKSRAPLRTWCYALEWVSAIRRLSASEMPVLAGRTPEEYVTGATPDISPYIMFTFYQPVRYLNPAAGGIFKDAFGYFLGVFDCAVDEMAFFVLAANGEVLVRKSVWALSMDEEHEHSEALVALKAGVEAKIGDQIGPDEFVPNLNNLLHDMPEDMEDRIADDVIEPYEDHNGQMETAREADDDWTPENTDEYIGSQLMLPHGGDAARATVVGRKRDKDGNPIGRRHDNPLLDTREYEVEFEGDGSMDSFTTNIIAENLYSQVDEQGRTYQILKEIVDHRKDNRAVHISDGMVRTRSGRLRKRITTIGWQLQVEWKDGSTSWVPLKDLKESNPIELAEYAVASQIQDEPAFAWWVRDVLRKRTRIICKVKSRYWSRTHKYGVELPKTVEEAYAIDKKTNTRFWRDAIEKEMKNVMPAFKFTDDDTIPIGFKKIDCHIVFDVKLVGLVRKARFVAGGHQTDPPADSVFSSVVTRDSVRIGFLAAALNDLDILSADVQNAYLNAETKEKVYTVAGLEFGRHNLGRPVLIVRALYGLKSSGARWRDHMAATLREGGFTGCRADPDVWMRPAVKPNGDKYYEYVLCYVDDILAISHKPQEIMDYLASKYTLKEGSVKPPDMYLGADVSKFTVPGDPREKWAMSSDTYVKRALADVEKQLNANGQQLRSRVSTPMSSNYRVELDATPELDDKQCTYYQGLIGVLRWICELGRIDIVVAVSMLSRYLANPREGHLEQALHVFAYLKHHDRSRIVFNDALPELTNEFHQCDWTEYYPGASEVVPPNAPEIRGKPMHMTCFVDADHAGCRETRRSHTGILIFLNKAPIVWYSKRQNTVETSTFGSEFVAMRQAVEMIEGLRYKVRMMGIEIEGSTSLLCDNESVVKNATRPESCLKKKHVAIAYHRVREAQAASIVRIAHQPGEFNLADVLTKLLPGPRLKELIGCILW